MILSDVVLWTLIIIGLMIVFNCHWLFAEAMFPRIVERAADGYRERPIRTLLVGLGIGVPAIALGIGALQQPGPMKLIGAIIVLGSIVFGLFGSAGLALQVGRGLVSPADERQPWRRVVRGGVILAFMFLLPFAGWFGFLPGALFSGLGAFVTAVRAERRARRAASVPVSENVEVVA